MSRRWWRARAATIPRPSSSASSSATPRHPTRLRQRQRRRAVDADEGRTITAVRHLARHAGRAAGTPAAGRESRRRRSSRRCSPPPRHNVRPSSRRTTLRRPPAVGVAVGVVDGVGEHGRVGGGGGGAHLPGASPDELASCSLRRAAGWCSCGARRRRSSCASRAAGGGGTTCSTRCPSRGVADGDPAARLRDGGDRLLRQGGGHGDGGAHPAVGLARGGGQSAARAAHAVVVRKALSQQQYDDRGAMHAVRWRRAGGRRRSARCGTCSRRS